MPGEQRTPVALAIAGSDSGGGAGIQADLKAFAAVGVHGTTAVTAITAQNTLGVDAIHAIPPEVIVAQVAAVAGDIGVDAVKIGMLGTTATIDAVVEALITRLPLEPSPDGDWIEALRKLARGYRQLAHEHPQQHTRGLVGALNAEWRRLTSEPTGGATLAAWAGAEPALAACSDLAAVVEAARRGQDEVLLALLRLSRRG